MIHPLQEFMDELLETAHYAGDFDWHSMPELDDDPEESIAKDLTPAEAHVMGVGPQEKKKHPLSDLEEATVIKLDEDQHLVTGWASVIEINGEPVVDRQGDIISEDELRKAVHKFMSKRNAGEMHKKVRGVGEIVDSLLVTSSLKKALRLPEDTPLGWVITVKVSDEDVWKKIKSGEYQMFSIGGKGRREPL